ncbi:rod shape-determining protein MreD [Lactobacillus sp.] [Lactiplantibacillus mudanjiangensis]|uniref:Rod shape-determining protein MreD [Lactobacillus sp.] n=1 Tax=Lactiplantibacillus mudanjiangensis TaxID=1296538 RepID=A0A660E5A2_9LACO|nr:rod shape-determining protein MreD [Lactiplantibacillus mudanjiangensis]VDG19186.1 rod shape-determining protein MreD [Lactobacillus sp.] [Lactiplantibacillus mudanjiangensis]VDG25649.1 rod shape-determining protein MreD [Lactobacillus sp.] [Lactiplantibacillus mudanjiangensis]VDG29954.1 rod shape-determining protein MreD [Lactobacillus sp.] [Lactiplantibacillus mudanjiangensis]VDG33256.1 rod shape-determining protein MreD [Lactobacillus sp.] [Lactiplantibacillus mudanjiangensis]
MRYSRLKIIFPIGLFLALFLDGSLSNAFAGHLFKYPYSSVLHLVLLWIVFAIFLDDRGELPVGLWAAFAGLIFDWYYTGVFGVYLVALPLVVYISRQIKPWLDLNFLTMLMVYIINLTIVEAFVYIWYLIGKVITSNLADFAVYTLGPTIAVNLALFVILYYPVRQLYLKVS